MNWWPLVWRATMEREVARAIQTNEIFVSDRTLAEDRLKRTEAVLQVERSRNDALQERLLSLKMTGAVEPESTPEALAKVIASYREQNPFPSKPDELRDLIHERAGGDLRRRSLMLAQLKRDRADGLSQEAIAKRIADGVQSEGIPS